MSEPSPREPAYEATRTVIRRWPPLSNRDTTAAEENARVWRAVEAALDAMRVNELLAEIDRLQVDLGNVQQNLEYLSDERNGLRAERDTAERQVGEYSAEALRLGEKANDLVQHLKAARDARLRIAEAHCKHVGEGGMTSGDCNECGYSWPCPTYVWATTDRDCLACWDPADDEPATSIGEGPR